MDAAAILAPLGDAALRATALLAAALLASRALRARPAALRHVVLASGLGAAVLLPLLGLVVPRLAMPILPAPGAAPVAAESPVVVQAPAVAATPALGAAEPVGAAEPGAPVPAVAAMGPVAALGAPGSPAPIASAVPASASPASPGPMSRLASWTGVLLAVWLIGAALMAARLLARRRRLRALRRDAATVDDRELRRIARAASGRLAIRRPVSLLWSDTIDVPVTFGVLRPVVLLPGAARDWSPARCRAVLDHELAHVRRLDALTQWVGDLAAVAYWLHPLVWKSIGEMRAERERACDDHVLNCGTPASAYARDLLEIAAVLPPQARHAAALAMARRSQLEGRVVAVLDPQVDRGSVSRVAMTLVVAACAALLLPLAVLEVGCAAARPAGRASAAATADPAAASEPAEPADKSAAGASASSSNAPFDLSPAPPAPPSPPAPPAPPAPPHAPAHDRDGGHYESHDEGGPPWSAQCDGQGRITRNVSIDEDAGRRTMVGFWARGQCTIDLRSEGDVTFRPDMSGIERISAGGYFAVAERVRDDLRVVRVTPGAGGALRHEYKVNGQARPMDDAARRWFGALLLTLERNSGFAADRRVPHLLARGGPGAVLAEIPHLGGDHVRSRYLRRMLEVRRLDEPTVERTLQIAGQRIRSDHELARVLLLIGGKYPLASAGSRTAFLRAATTMDSDHERARVLTEILRRPKLDREAARMALDSAVTMRSDYERARVLMAISDARLVETSMQPAYMNAVGRMKSDYERARVLIDLMTRQKLTADSARVALRAVSGMRSDYERARVLIALVGGGALRAGHVPLYLDAVRRMRSDHEQARVLVALASEVSLDAGGRSAYRKVASAIDSEYERKRALAALRRD